MLKDERIGIINIFYVDTFVIFHLIFSLAHFSSPWMPASLVLCPHLLPGFLDNKLQYINWAAFRERSTAKQKVVLVISHPLHGAPMVLS